MSLNEGEDNIDDVEGKVFIGGLSWQTTEATLRAHFEKFGDLTDVALMMDKRTGQPRGFGFIRLKYPQAADIVVSQEHVIDGRKVDVKKAVPRDRAPAPTRTESKKIFVGGLAAEVSDKIFFEYFSKFGVVKDAVVMVDRSTNRSRGFGFVTFETDEACNACVSTENNILGKWVEVKRAEPRDNKFDMSNPARSHGGMIGGPGMNINMGGYRMGRGNMAGGDARGSMRSQAPYGGRGMMIGDEFGNPYGTMNPYNRGPFPGGYPPNYGHSPSPYIAGGFPPGGYGGYPSPSGYAYNGPPPYGAHTMNFNNRSSMSSISNDEASPSNLATGTTNNGFPTTNPTVPNASGLASESYPRQYPYGSSTLNSGYGNYPAQGGLYNGTGNPNANPNANPNINPSRNGSAQENYEGDYGTYRQNITSAPRSDRAFQPY